MEEPTNLLGKTLNDQFTGPMMLVLANFRKEHYDAPLALVEPNLVYRVRVGEKSASIKLTETGLATIVGFVREIRDREEFRDHFAEERFGSAIEVPVDECKSTLAVWPAFSFECVSSLVWYAVRAGESQLGLHPTQHEPFVREYIKFMESCGELFAYASNTEQPMHVSIREDDDMEE